MDLDVAGKVYMVAGASRGLGFAIAKALVADGARVSVASRNEVAVHEAAAKLQAMGAGEAMAMSCDVRDAQALSAWTDATVARFGGLDGVVVNAGGPPPGKFDNFDDAAWQSAFELTLMSCVRMVRLALPHLRARGAGSILTITSSSIKEPIDVLLLSNVMRSGVVSLAKSLSRDLASANIRVNNLVPGVIATDRIAELEAFQAKASGSTPEALRRAGEAAVPMGRYGKADEFGKVGAFLLSPAASYMTGATVIVDGGSMKTVW